MGKRATSKAGGKQRPASEKTEAIGRCKDCDRWQEVKQRMRVAQFIEKTVDGVEKKLDSGEMSPTVAEYLKLLQLEQEWDQQESIEDGPKEIKVTWVGPVAAKNDEK